MKSMHYGLLRGTNWSFQLAAAAGWVGACPLLAGCGSAQEPTASGSGVEPAVMVAVATQSPEGMNLYVGAYSELPEEPQLDDMVETVGGQNASAFNGYVYVWAPDAGTYTRYVVDDHHQFTEDDVVSFAHLGGTGNVMTSFISPTRAYSMTRDNLSIIVWNPEAMKTIGILDTSAALDPDYPSFDYGEPVLFDGYVAWPILWYDYDKFDFKPAVDVLLASATSDEPAFAISDTRCGSGWSLFTDSEGDLYVLGNAWFGFAHFFDRDPSRHKHDCLLRVKAGTTEFDPSFYVDIGEAANTPAVYHTWQSEDRSVLAAVWDPADDPADLASPDDYWTTPLERKLVRIDAGESAPIQGIPKSAVFSTTNYRLDDQLFMLMSEGSTDPKHDQRSKLYRIRDDSAELALTTVGQLWSIGRIR